jgi:hypothetical protein
MTEKSGKYRLGITRNRFSDYLKMKGKKLMTKKRFSKASLRKTSNPIYIVQLMPMKKSLGPPCSTTQPNPYK